MRAPRQVGNVDARLTGGVHRTALQVLIAVPDGGALKAAREYGFEIEWNVLPSRRTQRSDRDP